MSSTERLSDFMRRKVGPAWVVARRTSNTLRRYPSSVFLSRAKYARLEEEWVAANKCPHCGAHPDQRKD